MPSDIDGTSPGDVPAAQRTAEVDMFRQYYTPQMSGVAVTVLYVQRVPGDVFKNSIVTVSDLDKPLMGQEIFTTHWRLLHCFNLF